MSENVSFQGYRVRSLLPAPPSSEVIDDAMLWVGRGRVQEVGTFSELKNAHPGAPVQDLGEKMMVPGVLNAHAHLELSHLQGRIPPGLGFEHWVRRLLQTPMQAIDPSGIERILEDLVAQGTVGIGDISGHNPQTMFSLHAQGRLFSRLFVEFLGFHRPHNRSWPVSESLAHTPWLSAAGHALYSTHPFLLQSLKAWTVENSRPFSMHLAEHAGEFHLLTTGRGSFADFLRDRLLPSDFIPPGLTPVAYADQLGLLDHQSLAVHCVFLEERDIELLRQRGVHICLCPRSNAYIDTGRAPMERLHRAGLSLCLGTDSLCSNHDCNIWEEAAYLADIWKSDLTLTQLISLITINPARALGLDDHLGCLQPGYAGQFSLVPDTLYQALPL